MSKASFDQYKAELISTIEQIRSRIQSKKGSGGEGDTTDELLQQCEDLVKQMGLEARGMDYPGVKHDLLAKVRLMRLLCYHFTRRCRIIYMHSSTCDSSSTLAGKGVQGTTSKLTHRI